MSILQAKKHFQQNQMIKEASLTYSSLEKALEK